MYITMCVCVYTHTHFFGFTMHQGVFEILYAAYKKRYLNLCLGSSD